MNYVGTVQDDALFGTAEPDAMHGDAGNDILDGKGGDDLIDAGDGDDLIFGGDGNDGIVGGGGRDDIYAGAGNDSIEGGDSDDVLRAEAGKDRLTGGKGNDTLIGGDGHDVAIFSGRIADYDVQYSYGLVTLTDRRPEAEGGEGMDYVLETERMIFADGIIFLAPNQAPAAAADSLTASEDGSLEIDAAGGLLANDSDPEEDGFSVAAVDGQTANVGQPVTRASGAQLTVRSDGRIVFDPLSVYDHLAAGATATETFTYTVTDAHGATATASASIQIQGQNDAPTAVDTAYGPATEDGTTRFPFAGGSDVDEGAQIAYAIVGAPAPSLGELQLTDDGGFSFTAGAALDALGDGETATVSFTYRAADEHGAQSAPRTATITVAGRNDAPEAADVIGDQAGREGEAFAFQLGDGAFRDLDANDTLTFEARLAGANALPGWLRFDPATRQFSGTPGGQDAGVYDIAISATDGHDASADSGFKLTIADVPPVVSPESDSGLPTETPAPPAPPIDTPAAEQPNVPVVASPPEDAPVVADNGRGLAGDADPAPTSDPVAPSDGTGSGIIYAGRDAEIFGGDGDDTIHVVQDSARVHGGAGRDVIDARGADYDDASLHAVLLLDGGAGADTYYLGSGRDAVHFRRDPADSNHGQAPVDGDVIVGFQAGQDQLVFLDYAGPASSTLVYRVENDLWAATRVSADGSMATEYLRIAGSENYDLVAGRDYRFASTDPQQSDADLYSGLYSTIYAGPQFNLYNDIWAAAANGGTAI